MAPTMENLIKEIHDAALMNSELIQKIQMINNITDYSYKLKLTQSGPGNHLTTRFEVVEHQINAQDLVAKWRVSKNNLIVIPDVSLIV